MTKKKRIKAKGLGILADRDNWLIVHGADLNAWIEKYDLRPFSAPCIDCKAELTSSIPFACGPLRGLVAPKCKCGAQFPPYCVILDPKEGDDLISWAIKKASNKKE